jgi:hypothetical protein
MSKFKPLKLNPGKWIYIGCIPYHASRNSPHDQSPCVLDECPHCKGLMWVSEKKRILKETLGQKARIYCLECLARSAVAQGFEPELYDIGGK